MTTVKCSEIATNKIANMGNVVENYVMNDLVWKVDVPAFLNEIATASKNTPYKATFKLLNNILAILTQRAIELNDPALNIIMLNMGLYDNSHDKNIQEIKDKERNRISEQYIIK